MKLLVGLAVFFMMAGFTFYLAGTQRIHALVTAVLLSFSLLSGFVIANYDWLERLRFEVPGLQLYEDRVLRIREEAIQELRGEVERRKKELSDLMAEHADLTGRLESQKKNIEAVLDSTRSFENELKEKEQALKDIAARAELARDHMVAVQGRTSELALLLTRITWLQFQAANQQSPERAEAAVKQIMDGLDEIVGLVITDPQARNEFVSGVMGSLPPPRP
jgi:septal ring factor EnvC (AmiA/AmiB activator)